MIDYLYKFPDEATAQIVLANYYNTKTGWRIAGTGYCLDPIGNFADVDNTDPKNPIITPLEGWHVNLRTWDDRTDPAPSYRIFPNKQRRVWL